MVEGSRGDYPGGGTEDKSVGAISKGMDSKVRVYLRERRVKTLGEAIRLTENYHLVKRPSYGAQHALSGARGEAHGETVGREGVMIARCYVYGSAEHLAAACPKGVVRR